MVTIFIIFWPQLDEKKRLKFPERYFIKSVLLFLNYKLFLQFQTN